MAIASLYVILGKYLWYEPVACVAWFHQHLIPFLAKLFYVLVIDSAALRQGHRSPIFPKNI